ncbi:hypothetical protein CW304_21350 [Bacillus sp. UFRGS-B20]|nr:hypothetical protein CW304_21350 [Bacillus sp. UFRGS-B20]
MLNTLSMFANFGSSFHASLISIMKKHLSFFSFASFFRGFPLFVRVLSLNKKTGHFPPKPRIFFFLHPFLLSSRILINKKIMTMKRRWLYE